MEPNELICVFTPANVLKLSSVNFTTSPEELAQTFADENRNMIYFFAKPVDILPE